MKTPSFLELQSLVEYLSEELRGSQLQEIMSTEDGLVLVFYRYARRPATVYLVFDLDRMFPFLGFFTENPWPRLKKTRPVALFLNAHARNRLFQRIGVRDDLGRVVLLEVGEGQEACSLEFRLIPRQANLLLTCAGKSLSWRPMRDLVAHEPRFADESEVRSLSYMMTQWWERRAVTKPGGVGTSAPAAQSPYDKWKKNREKDLAKKKKALGAVKQQIELLESEEWSRVGEYLKQSGLKNIPPEWSIYVDFKKTASENMQICFRKAKAAKLKISGAHERLRSLQREISALSDLGEEKFAAYLAAEGEKRKAPPARKVEGRLRKYQLPAAGLTAYMGKSAAVNMDLLRRAKPHDLWLHLKDYPSAHAIIHLEKGQKMPEPALYEMGQWLVREGLPPRHGQMGGKFAVIVAECRHVRPLKGDKLGRVTYHNAREILIAV